MGVAGPNTSCSVDGPESKRNSGDGGYFSLDFSFYRTALPENAPISFTVPSAIRTGFETVLVVSDNSTTKVPV